MADYMEFSKLLNELQRYGNSYKKYCANKIIIEEQCKKSDSAGNELYDTLTDNFEKFLEKSESLDASDKILEDYLSIINEESFHDVLLEMYNNLPKRFDSDIRERLRLIVEKNIISDSDDSDSSSYTSDSNVDNEFSRTVSRNSSCRRSSRLQSRQNKYIKNRRDDKYYLEDPDKDFDYDDIDSSTCDVDNVSIQKVVLDPTVHDKLDSMIETDLNAVINIELNTKKIADKVHEITHCLGISRRIIGPIVAKLSIGGYSELITKKKCWSNLKERMQVSMRRLYAWIINKEAILFIHSLCPKKAQYYGNDKIVIPKPSYFWLNCKDVPMDEVERTLTPPALVYEEENCPTYGEFKPNVRVNKYIRAVESDPTISEIIQRTGKTYEFQNKNIILANIKHMTTKSFKFKGYLNTVEICKEIRKHLTETNCSQRSFAENILGMSQGSASDLLTKPKKWEGLTRRGREPYVKMRAYLDVHLELKDQLKSILEEEEREQLEKLKMLYKHKVDENKKKIDTTLLLKVLGNYGDEKSPPSSDSGFVTEPCDFNTSYNEENCSEKSILQKTEELFHNKRNFKVVAKVSNSNQNLGNQPIDVSTVTSSFPSLFTESLNTMALAVEMKTLLDECKVTPAIFAEKYMKIKPQDFHRLLVAPRAWNLSSMSDRSAYEKINIFLRNKDFVKCLKERGLGAFPLIQGSINNDHNQSQQQNNDKYIRLIRPLIPLEASSSLCNSKVIKVCIKKRQPQVLTNCTPIKKQKLTQNYSIVEDDSKIKKSNNVEKVIRTPNNSLNGSRQSPRLVPFDKEIPTSSGQGVNNSEINEGIKKDLDGNSDSKNIVNTKSVGSEHDSLTIQVKEEFTEKVPETNGQSTPSNDSLTNHDVEIDTRVRDPKSFTILHEDNMKPIHKEELNVYDVATCHGKFIKYGDNLEFLIDTAELEILYLAWTYNPNPQSVMKEYLSQMTVLPIEAIEAWYSKFNKLKGNYLRTADNSLTYRENLRKIVLTSTSRKKFLAVTDLVFKQLFSNKIAELINTT
uniref:Homeobox protein cut (inferred by orthology to a D. melanogaster protein) n=1 Tax=Strongyloides venezuelensis TaxID=75913 RepID=A0A0K0EVK9_STRVS